MSDFLVFLPLSLQQIDGRAFLLLTQRDIVRIMSIKLGPALKIYNSILMFKHTEERKQSEDKEKKQFKAEDTNESQAEDLNDSHGEDDNQPQPEDRNQSPVEDRNQSPAEDKNQTHTGESNQSHIEDMNQSLTEDITPDKHELNSLTTHSWLVSPSPFSSVKFSIQWCFRWSLKSH